MLRLLLLLVGLLAPAAAMGHASLVGSTPTDGVRLEAAPTELGLRFDEPVALIALRLIGGNGQEVGTVVTTRGGGEIVAVPSRPLTPGSYLLSYRVASADSHPVGGTLRFSLQAELDGALQSAAPTVPVTGSVGLRAAHYGAALLALGLLTFCHLVRPPVTHRASLRRLLVVAAATAGFLALLRIGVAGAELAGLPAASLLTAAPWAVAMGRPIGAALAMSAFGLLLMALAARLWQEHRLGTAVMLAGAFLAVLAFTLAGHGATIAPRWFGAAATALHVACAAVWTGGLVGLLLVLRQGTEAAGPVVARYARLATAAVILLLLAGMALTWVQIGLPANLVGSDYGRLLLGKLAFVAGLLALGAVNLLHLEPRLLAGRAGAAGWLRRSLAVDALLAAGAIVMTATLGMGPPPRLAAGGAITAAPAGFTTHLAGHGFHAMLDTIPAKRGPNRLDLLVEGEDGAPVRLQEVALALSQPGVGIEPIRLRAVAAPGGGWELPAVDLPVGGRWEVILDLLVDDFTRRKLAGELLVQ